MERVEEDFHFDIPDFGCSLPAKLNEIILPNRLGRMETRIVGVGVESPDASETTCWKEKRWPTPEYLSILKAAII